MSYASHPDTSDDGHTVRAVLHQAVEASPVGGEALADRGGQGSPGRRATEPLQAPEQLIAAWSRWAESRLA
jgi:hypothetical protein